MATIFTRIIDGELPGRFVWRDDQLRRVPVDRPAPSPATRSSCRSPEVDHWIDLAPPLAAHLMHGVASIIGRAQQEAFAPDRIGLIIAGLEVPHAHSTCCRSSPKPTSTSPTPTTIPIPPPSTVGRAPRAALRAAGHAEVASR